LQRVYRLDSVKLDSRYFTDEGYLVDAPIVTSVGIFEYTNEDGTIRRELRLPEHVFAPESLATYEGKPIIITHRAGRVTKRNVDDVYVGTMLSRGYRDGEDVRVKIVIHSIDEVKRRKFRELSLGYDLDLIEEPGQWEGQPYDAIQTNIVINHLALVGDARAGEQARLNIDGETGDTNLLEGGIKRMANRPKGKPLSASELKARLGAIRQRRIDEAEAEKQDEFEDEDPINTKGADAEDIEGEGDENADEDTLEEPGNSAEPPEGKSIEERIGLVKDRRDRRDESGVPDTLEAALAHILQQDEDIEELVTAIEEVLAERDFNGSQADENTEEQPESLTFVEEVAEALHNMDGKGIAKAVDQAVRERTKLLRIGDKLRLDGLEDMTPMQMKRAIIAAVVPKMRLDGKGETYVNAAFDMAVDTLNSTRSTERQRRQMTSRRDSAEQAPAKPRAEAARERMNSRLKGGTE